MAALAFGPDRRPVLLLVEDHADTRTMYAEFLATAFEVRQASDGAAALDAMRERPPDLVVTDLSLPRVDGFELVATMRADARLKDVPVICISGYGGHVHEERAQAAGCDSLLMKPCLPDTLLEIAGDVLRRRGRSWP